MHRRELRFVVWTVLVICILLDFGIIEWLTFQPDVVNIDLDSKAAVEPQSTQVGVVGYIAVSGFLLLQVGLVVAILRLREGISTSQYQMD